MALTTAGGFLRKVAGTGQGLGGIVVTPDPDDPFEVGLADGTTVGLAEDVVFVVDDVSYGYAAGTGDATVDVPANARVRRVMVIANASVATTVTIAGGNTITIPAGGSFNEQIPGQATLGGDVVIGGGDSLSYYVAWTVES